MLVNIVIMVFSTAIVFLFLGWLLNSYFGKRSLKNSRIKAEQLIGNAKEESESLKKEKLLEANEESYALKQKLEDEYRGKKVSFQKEELRLNEKDANIDRKADLLSKKERDLESLEKDLQSQAQQTQNKQEKLSRLIHEQNQKLEHIAGLTSEAAKNILMENLYEEARQDAAKIINSITEEAKVEAKKKAQNIILTAIQQSGINMAIESTVSVVSLPSDDMKGRIIGREGRNIRAFEIVSGVDVIVDDTPGSIILSGFDPLRREISRIVMERLVADGRIHPGRIEDMFEKVKNEMDEYLRELGEQALLECGVHGVHMDVVQLLGKLRFRATFGQNALQHSKEVSIIAGIMAAELGVDVNLAKRAGILHDIGRAVEIATDDDHAQIGHDIAKKYNENQIVVNAIAAHHGEVEPISPIAVLVQTANEISISRPGARREAVESFIKRLQQMEQIAASFDGVEMAYAIQAGKEIRVIVAYQIVDDPMLNQLTKDIASKIEEETEYPGQIKIVVIREFRGIDYA
jgi:ribonuclease Y